MCMCTRGGLVVYRFLAATNPALKVHCVRFAQAPERVSTKRFVVLITGVRSDHGNQKNTALTLEQQAPLWHSLVTCVEYCLRLRQCQGCVSLFSAQAQTILYKQLGHPIGEPASWS